MPTPLFSHRNAKELVDRIKDVGSDADNKLYVFLARRTPWTDDQRPPRVDLFQSYQYEIWDRMSLLRRVTPPDVEYGIRRVEWEFEKKYTAYDDTIDLQHEDFYIVTPENNVYVCIDNNGGSPSLNQPTHLSESIIEEPDGYRWKYITTISQSLMDKFIIPGYVPFEENPVIQESAIPGTIDRVVIENNGVGYEPNRTVENDNPLMVFIEGDGDQYGTATVNIATVQNSIATSEVSNPGEGYNYGPIEDITVENGGEGYDFGPGVAFPVAIRQSSQDGMVQTAYGIATTNLSGGIDSIEIIIRGEGYQDGEAQIIQSSAEAYVETNEDGEIVNAKMSINKYGSNFHKARAVILSEQLEDIDNPAELRLVLSPRDGHGFRQFQDIFTVYALFAIRIDTFDVLDEISFEDFRIIGLIDSPLSREFETIGNDDDSGSIEDDIVLDTQTRTWGTTTPSEIASFDSNNITSAKVLVQASSLGESHVTEMLIVHDGTSVFTTEYGKVTTIEDHDLFSLDVELTSSGMVYIMASGATVNTTNYVTYLTLIKTYEESEDDNGGVVIQVPKVLDEPIGDPKYRLVLDTENSQFTEGETIIGATSGAIGIGASKFGSHTLRYMPDNTLYSDQVNGFEVGEDIRGQESSTIARIVDVIESDVIRYSGDIFHINNIRPINFDPKQNILITFALKF